MDDLAEQALASDDAQYSLGFDYPPAERIVQKPINKSVAIVHMYPINGEYDGYARRVFNALLAIALGVWARLDPVTQERYLSERRVIRFQRPISHIRKILGPTSKSNTRVWQAAEALYRLEFRFDLTREMGATWEVLSRLVGQVARPKDRNPSAPDDLVWEYPPDVFEMLMKPARWAVIDLRLSNALKSQYSIALYENTNRYIGNPSKLTACMPVETWMDILASGAPSLPRFKRPGNYRFFKREVLAPAMKELAEAPSCRYTLELKEVYEGKRVATLQFQLRLKERNVGEPAVIVPGDPQLRAGLKQLGLSDEEIDDYMAGGEDDLRRALEVTRLQVDKGGVRRPLALFKTALSKGYELPQDPAAAALEQQHAAEERQRAERDREELSLAFKIHRGDKTRAYFNNQSKLMQDALVSHFLATEDGKRVQKVFGSDGFNNPQFGGSFFAWLASNDGVLVNSEDLSEDAYAEWAKAGKGASG